jgi:hypothetical protein
VGHGPLLQVYGVLPFGGKENLFDLLWSDRNGLALGVVRQLSAKVQEVGYAEEGPGQANLHPCFSGIVFTDPLCCSIKVSVHDLNVILNQENITHEGKAPKVVPDLSNSLDGPLIRAKLAAAATVAKGLESEGRGCLQEWAKTASLTG